MTQNGKSGPTMSELEAFIASSQEAIEYHRGRIRYHKRRLAAGIVLLLTVVAWHVWTLLSR